MSGRWFTGAYDETGIDVTLTRIGGDPVVLGASVTALKTGATAAAVEDLRRELPARAERRGHRLRPGRQGRAHRQRAARRDRVEVEVAEDAPIGARDLRSPASVKAAALVVYDKIDGIKVTPQAGMARVGGNNFPKQFQQFEAIAYHNGPDGKPDTDDDLEPRPRRPSSGRIEEYTATFGDDDKAVCRHDRRERPVHAERRRPESEAHAATATTSATCGWSPS